MTNDSLPNLPPYTPSVRAQNDAVRAQAVAEVRQMQLDLESSKLTIEGLKNDLHRAEDRIILLTDERTRLRKESNIYRTKLIELATAMANIGLLTTQAQTILTTAEDLINAVDGFDSTDPEATARNKTKIDAINAAATAVETAIAPHSQNKNDPVGPRASDLRPPEWLNDRSTM